MATHVELRAFTLLDSLQPVTIEADGSHLLRTWQRIQGKFPHLELELLHRETLLSVLAAESYPAAYHAVARQDFAGLLARIEIPVLVMAGEQDTLRSALEPAFERLQAGSKWLLPGAGTYICDTHAEVLARRVSLFFRE